MDSYLSKSGIGSATAAINTVKQANPNFADSVDYAAERVGILLGRLEAITNRLCGTVPQDVGAVPQAVPNGLLDGVMSKAGAIALAVDAGLDMVSRIERSLP